MTDFNQSTLDRVAAAAGVSSEEDISVNITQDSSSSVLSDSSNRTVIRSPHTADWVDAEGVIHTAARTRQTGILTDDPSATLTFVFDVSEHLSQRCNTGFSFVVTVCTVVATES